MGNSIPSLARLTAIFNQLKSKRLTTVKDVAEKQYNTPDIQLSPQLFIFAI
ncbi:hypothetical protein SAMN05660903_02535 [Salegentibacter salinarum]|uniref:hypothetical protein n=1 Tax=Salegentibacter salinarum TaxID=447422 RepID=UPI0009D290BB|nr:hypothetical protein [Salegentibacter salinarum]SKB78556.1 hypothetical protein SAMN05660903_02535 [Salegentibacter salinarum]